MASRPTFTAEEAKELVLTSLVESDIPKDPEFPLPTFESDEAVESDNERGLQTSSYTNTPNGLVNTSPTLSPTPSAPPTCESNNCSKFQSTL